MSLKTWASRGPTAVYSFRYEKEGTTHFREISVPSGYGRFGKPALDEARELADRRLNEQFGYQPRKEVQPQFVDGEPLLDEDGNHVHEEVQVFDIPPQDAKGNERPDLLQDNYQFVSSERIK